MEKPVGVVLVDETNKIFYLVFLLFVYCKTWMLDPDFILVPLHIAAANKLIINFLNSFEVKVI